jgi:hypothetical protein
VRFEVGASWGVDYASLVQCLMLRGFVNCQCLVFCPSFWYVSVMFEVHKYMGPNSDIVQRRIHVG